MALLYRAELVPTKLELITAWLPTRDWFAGPAPAHVVSRCRLDDPDGRVGVEILLVAAGDGPVYHTPLTYRAAPLAGAESSLLGTTEHSVLGTRWVYDAPADPVYAAVVTATIASAAHEAEEWVHDADGGNRTRRDPAMRLQGTGTPDATGGRLETVRALDASFKVDAPALTGRWNEDGREYVLAYLA